MRRCGGIGIRNGFKIHRPKGHAGSSPVIGIGEKMSIEEAFNYIFEELQKSFSILEDHGLIETLWDENGESSVRPTKKLMDLEKKGILRDYVQEIFPKEEE